ncbi:MAG: acyl-CoA dehydratase activase [Termitinemataceae bacterium]|nr:MAG: acyl-CoA dehydratase activase [Termitinemataceae bacterium]
MQTLGINIGSTSIKLVYADCNTQSGTCNVIYSGFLPHEGDFSTVVQKLLDESNVEPGTPVLVTGNEGRFMFNCAGTLEPLCVEAALKTLKLDGAPADAVVSMGGEDLIVYSLDSTGKIINNFSGNKCASGTGEFLKQQLARMNMELDDINKVSDSAKVYPLSTRCSVFMKSDCTHRLNKREATKDDIVLSLSDVMAVKVIDFLKRAKVTKGRVILTGGITLNRHIIRFIKEKEPNIEFIIPESAPFFEAIGAAMLAESSGSAFPEKNKLLRSSAVKFGTLPALKDWQNKVKFFDSHEIKVQKGRKYILGVDGGSTTTKACLVDMETDEIAASHYGRTHGDPVKALKECLKIIQDKICADTGSKEVDITLVSATGSSREILGVFLETSGVYNEIIAHSVGTTYFDKEVETIFEIGGQDAKYVFLKNGVPIDYAMNEACSAGTGSFLEESASGDLSIKDARDIGPIAINADSPLKFGEHCSAFINSDIRKAVQQGATKENITAGIIGSIVANYLNRVVGNRTIGGKVFLQGGVAKNPGVPLAFAMMLNKEILVPPSPELMGCFGVALLAKKNLQDGLLTEKSASLDEFMQRNIVYESIFTCKACENHCPIQVLNVSGNKYMFGGRCNKYTNMRKSMKDVPVFDYVSKRQQMLFVDFAAPCTINNSRNYTVGIPRALSTHTLYPLYSWFFYELGIKTFLSDTVAHAGVARAESTYCFPAEIAHGAVQDCLDKGADYVLLPHFRDMPSYEKEVHANFCPITQALPYYIEKAFPDIDKKCWLPLVVSFKFGDEKAFELFCIMTQMLGISAEETRRAFDIALAKQNAFFDAYKKMGEQALEDARKADRPVIAILGRPYNAFTQEANMGIPRKFTSRGFSIVPFDMLPFEDQKIFPNMYWYYGQQDVKSANFLKKEPNIYVTYVTNFSCAPDSFILHYLKWAMGTKPFIVLELDSHSADAGVDTRVEAFLDIIDGYRKKQTDIEEERYDNGWRFVAEDLSVKNEKTGEKLMVKGNKRVKMLLSNMGNISTQYISASLASLDINTVPLPVATVKTVQAARAHASGKECVPSHLVLGGVLEFLSGPEYRKDELYIVFVPITTGPCRTGQYFVYYENLFRDLRIENIVFFILSADNSYSELGKGFSKQMWYGVVIADYLKDIQNALKTCALDPKSALIEYENSWHNVMEAARKHPKDIWKRLKETAAVVKKIPLKRKLEDCPCVLVVGEIFVRRDDFAIRELTELMSERGIVVKVSGIAEWIHYLDFVREYALKKLIKLGKGGSGALLKLRIEKYWKHSIEKKTSSILKAAGLVPSTPHDMKLIMSVCKKNFVDLELNSEIAVSSGAAATAMEHGYSGVVNIAPFACLIGRVIEGLYTPWARERNYPTLSVEVDGNLLPPNIINKLNIFMVNVLRFRGKGNMDELVDKNEMMDKNEL